MISALVLLFGLFQLVVRGVERLIAVCDSVFDKGGDASLCCFGRDNRLESDWNALCC